MRILFFLLFTVGLHLQPIAAQQESTPQSVETATTDSFTFFQSIYTGNDDFLELKLLTDTRQLIRKKYNEEYQPAQLKLTGKAGQPVTYNLKLRSRGNVRKKVCYYPPIKLNFKKPELTENGLLRKSDKIKLVLQCRNSSSDEAYLLKEYLIYKLYNLFTPHSFRVQLAKVHLEDSEEKAKTQTLHAILIEPIEELAERTNGVVVERESGSSFMLEREPYKWMSAFQYMIGNTDWSPKNVHNLEFMKVPEYDKLIPIPYDFDYAGLVGTDYAVPAEVYPIESVQERYYVGFSYSESETEALIDRLKALEPEIMNYCRQFTALDESSRKNVLHYLGKFFDMLDYPRAVHTAFQNN